MNNSTKNLFDFVWKNLLLAIVYGGVAIISKFYVGLGHLIVTPIFPAAGLAFAATLWWGYRVLPGVWLGTFFYTVLLGHHFLLGIIVGTGNTLQTFFSAWLLITIMHTKTPFYRVKDVTVFIFGSAFLGCLINSSIGTTAYYLFDLITPANYLINLFKWWMADAIAVILFGTVIMVWYNGKKTSLPRQKTIELIIFFLLLLIFIWLESFKHWPFARLLLPFVIWSTVRFGLRITSLVCLLISIVFLYWGVHWYYVYTGISTDKAILFSQSFIVIMFFMSLMLNAVLAEREKLKEHLTEANINLENRVMQRTQALAEKNSVLNNTIVELKHAQAQLIQAEKMSALGILTAGIAHEINNSVNFISANITPLKNDIADLLLVLTKYREVTLSKPDEEQFEAVKKLVDNINLNYTLQEMTALLAGIQDGAQRTTTIVKDLRTFSRLDEGALKYASVHQNIESTLTLLKSYYRDRINIVKSYGDIPDIECYPGKINQVIMNLLTNAAQAIPDKGEIIITTAKPDSHHITISIKDSGTGMSKEVMDKIFEPFFTTKEVGKGTGLGLPISYSIIQEHNGTITVHSEVGKGSEFIVTLPVRQQFASHTKNQK